MKKLLLAACAILTISVNAQTTIYSENFNSVGAWTLNTINGAEGAYPNMWYVSCQEDGQSAGNCGTACTISDNSLHVSANPLLGDLGAAYFEGLGTNTNRRASSGNINTVGATSLSLSFDMIGAGNAQDYTELVYSTNGGTTWTSLATPLTSLCCGGVACTGSLQGLWQTNTYSLPASCEGITNLRIGFIWRNTDDGSATDPSFAVDDILITGTVGVSNAISTLGNVVPTNWCYDTPVAMNVAFTSTGVFAAGNTYTAQLSDAAGSFASPLAIGTLNSVANSGTINATIPGGVAPGTGYRVRVISSNPATVGSDNGSNLTINALPNVTQTPFNAVCNTDPMFTLTGGSPAGGDYSGNGVTANVFEPAVAGAGTHTITYLFVDGNGCANTAEATILVNDCAGVDELSADQVFIYPNPVQASFQISGIDQVDAVFVIDLLGKVVRSYGHQTNYTVSGISSGSYFVQIIKGDRILNTPVVIR